MAVLAPGVGRAPVAAGQTAAVKAASGQTAANLSTPDVAGLLHEAAVALEGNRLGDAAAALETAKAVNPTQLGLYALYGDLHSRRGEFLAAIADYRKELALHPELHMVYRSLANAQRSAAQNAEAAGTLRSWQTAEPNNAQPLAMLVTLLADEGRPAEAVQAGESGITLLTPDVRGNPQLLLALGSAECSAGHRDKGIAMLLEVLSASGLALRNDAAYLLADMNVDLPAVETAQRETLDRISLVTEGWSLNESLPALTAGTLELAAAWDTMGWILFREGRFDQAESYTRASWRNNPRAEVGEHLGEIEAARGDPRGALADFRMAVAALPKAADRTATAQQVAAQLEQKLAAGTTAGARSPPEDAATALARIARFKLGPAAGLSGEAPYRMLISRGKVIQAGALAAGGATLPRGAQILARAELSALFPSLEGYTQLFHVGTLRCDGTVCELVLGSL